MLDKHNSIPEKLYKVQASGNDFVFFVDLGNFFAPKAEDVQNVCNRHFGIGGDGLIRIGTTDDGTYFMDYYNADGTTAQMCGNGVRATVCLLQSLGLFEPTNDEDSDQGINIMTRAGLKQIKAFDNSHGVMYSVNMGECSCSLVDTFTVSFEVTADDKLHTLPAYFSDIGNEHLVVDITDTNISLDDIDLHVKPKINVINDVNKQHASFTETLDNIKKRVLESGANIEFIKKFDENTINLRVYERGVGETLSCGTGVCASALVMANISAQNTSDTVDQSLSAAYHVLTPGGRLEVKIDNNVVHLIGGAKVVAEINYLGRDK